MNVLPTAQNLSASLIQDRVERHLSDLSILLAKVTRSGWDGESAEVQAELARATLARTPPSSFSSFTDLARLQFRFQRDVRLVVNASYAVKTEARIRGWLKSLLPVFVKSDTITDQPGRPTFRLSQTSITSC